MKAPFGGSIVTQTQHLSSLVVITGMSGSGKHTAFKAFEDLGYFCVDNIPTLLIPRLIQMSVLSGGEITKLAIVVDIRLRESISGFHKLYGQLKRSPFPTTIIFVDASDEALARRYSETRRVHPLARDRSLLEGIREERKSLTEVRALADLVIDTTDFSVHDLRNFIYENFRESSPEEGLNISVVSFGFKHGLPHNSDMVFDVRFLPNPHFVPELKARTGNDPEVVKFMCRHPETEEILQKIEDMLTYLIPKYSAEGKTYLTISIGCTGGKHRSVMVANEIAARLRKRGQQVNLIHRDLNIE